MMNLQVNSEYIHLDFEQAKTKHLLFKSKLRSILYGAQLQDEAPILSHFECTVGKWIYNHALKAYGHIPEMLELEKIHADIHTSARKLVTLYKENKVEEARIGLVEMEKIADHLVGLLAIVEHKLTIHPPKEVTPYLGLEANRIELNDLLIANDVLDKKIREQSGALLHERELLRNFFMQTPASFCILKSPNHIFELANASYLRIIGKKDIIGKTVKEVLPEIEGQGFIKLLDHVYNTGEPFIGKEMLVQINKNEEGDLEDIYVNFIYQALRNIENKIEGIIVFAHDVTELVIARKKAEESEHRYHELISSSPSMISILRGENMVIEVANDAILETWGKGKNVIGKPFLEVLPEIIEQGLGERLSEVYHTGKAHYAYEMPVNLIRNGKSELSYYTFFYQPQKGVSGNIEGVAIIATEVTPQAELNLELREREQRFRNLADESPIFVFIIEPDAEASISYWNKTWLTYTGQTLEAALGRAWNGIIHPDDLPVVMNYYLTAFKARQSYLIPAVRILRFDGAYRWFSFKGNPRYSANGEFKGYIGVGFDVDDQVKALQQKDEFISIASHELKTPVTSLKGFTQILQMKFAKEKDEQAVYLLSKMDKQINKLTSLIVDLLDATKIENGQLKFNLEIFDLNILINDVAEEIQRTTMSHKISIKENVEILVNGDRNRIGQVLTNFISNAIKYSPDDKEIIISCKCDGSTVSVSVQDFGIGIPKEKQPLLFNRFYRASGKGEETYPGLGLGLFISKEIIKRHNGNVDVKSEDGQGSTFSFTLPVN